MKVDVAVLGSPSLISLMVSVDVKHLERGRLPGLLSLAAFIILCLCVFWFLFQFQAGSWFKR